MKKNNHTEGDALSSRRKLMASLPGMLASSLPALALGVTSEEELQTRTHHIIDRANASGLPDTVVTTHRGTQVLFHKDLVQDRVVLINFMSIGDETECPACTNLARLIEGLGECFGRDVFAISVSYDSVNDTPERLAEFAQRFGVPDGWHFVTASAEDVITVGYKLYRAQGRPRRQMDSHLIHYGNARVGLWGMMSSSVSDVSLAVRRVRSVMFVSPTDIKDTSRRAGPPRLEVASPTNDHRNSPGLV